MGVALNIAISPSSLFVALTAANASSTLILPISALLDGFKCIARPAVATPESKETTLIPRFCAFLRIGTNASVSFAEITIAFTFCAIRELIISIWPSAVGVTGPV